MNKPAPISKKLSDNQAPKLLPTSDKLREGIIKILKESDDKVPVTKIQSILNNVLQKYDVTGYAVYSELRDMLSEGILAIDNNILNTQSIVSINTYKRLINKEDNKAKTDLIISFNYTENEINRRVGVSPSISLHCNYDYMSDRDNFINNDAIFCLISYKSPEADEFIKKWNFERWYITKLPENFSFILGTYGMTIKVLEKGRY